MGGLVDISTSLKTNFYLSMLMTIESYKENCQHQSEYCVLLQGSLNLLMIHIFEDIL